MKEREKRGKEKGIFWDLENTASPFLSSHGETRLDPFQDHIWSLARPCKPRVYDGDGALGQPLA
jgi:hypothetical protein